MKKVASYSLFWLSGDDHSYLYSNGLKAICRAHHTLMPGWELRIHHDGSLDRHPTARLLFAYQDAGLVTLVDNGPVDKICLAMLWRMMPLWDQSVSHTICRDLDSLPTPRDAVAVRQFVESGAALHALCDNPQHGAPIMGGLCGFKNELFRMMTGLNSFHALTAGEPLDRHGDDQLLLLKKVWPTLQNSLCEHRVSGHPPSASALKSYSTIEVGPIAGVPDFVMQNGDALIPYMGVAGFDPFRAVDFYDKHGVPEMIGRIQRAEAAA